MSAALGTTIVEADGTEPPVKEWIDSVLAGIIPDATDGNVPVIAATASSAVDAMEIAAGLEAAGLSHQVVNDQYGHPDVFSLASRLWDNVPFKPTKVEVTMPWRRGNWTDIGRGALYVAPALMLLALAKAAHTQFAWWALPLALTWGWGIGQLIAFVGHTLRGRGEKRAEKVVCGWLLVYGVASTALLAALAQRTYGGGVASLLATAGVTTYMISSAVLLLHDEDRLGALLLAPGALGTLMVLVCPDTIVFESIAAVLIGGCALTTLVAAARHLGLRPGGSLALRRSDLLHGLSHFTHGLLCGIALSLVGIEGAQLHPLGGRPALVAMPLLLTLGIMEWQLRTFKYNAVQLMRSSHSIRQFRPKAWTTFCRSCGIYMLGMVVVSALVVAVALADGSSPPYVVLDAQLILGGAFFLDLTIVSFGRIDLVVRCWGTGVLAAVAVAMAEMAESVPTSVLTWRAACIGTAVAFVALLFATRRVTSASMNH